MKRNPENQLKRLNNKAFKFFNEIKRRFAKEYADGTLEEMPTDVKILEYALGSFITNWIMNDNEFFEQWFENNDKKECLDEHEAFQVKYWENLPVTYYPVNVTISTSLEDTTKLYNEWKELVKRVAEENKNA